MKTVLVTGARGFIGKNLLAAFSSQDGIKITCFTSDDDIPTLNSLLEEVDIIYHLAGINRPVKLEEFASVNTGLTQTIVSILSAKHKTPAVVMSSSTQAELYNPYGVSKKKAEDTLIDYGKRTGALVYIYRLANRSPVSKPFPFQGRLPRSISFLKTLEVSSKKKPKRNNPLYFFL